MSTLRPLAVLALAAAALSACSSNKAAVLADAAQKTAVEAPAAPVETAKVTSAADPKLEGATALAAALRDLQSVSVFFQTDDDRLSGEAKAKLGAVGGLLAKFPLLKVRIEGNCDERGTPEHNLALGQRRAVSARRYLGALGARDEQMQTVSLGDEKPKDKGHGEQAWSVNRRDDVIAIETHQ